MRHRVRVALYNRLFAQSNVALCSGVGDKIPPWGKGLKGQGHEIRKGVGGEYWVAEFTHNKI